MAKQTCMIQRISRLFRS